MSNRRRFEYITEEQKLHIVSMLFMVHEIAEPQIICAILSLYLSLKFGPLWNLSYTVIDDDDGTQEENEYAYILSNCNFTFTISKSIRG